MANSTIALDEPAVTDKLLDTSSLTVGANTVQRERMNIADPTLDEGLAIVTDSDPASDAYGLVVRPLGVVTVQGTGSFLTQVQSIGGVTPAYGTGVRGATVQRVTIATDDVVPVTNSVLSVVGGGVEATAQRVTIASDSTGVLSVDDNGGSLTVDGTVAVTGVATLTEQQTQTTALQLIDDIVYVDDTATHSTGVSKGALIMAAATPTDATVSANDIGAVGMTTDRKLHVAVMDQLPAGTSNIGDIDVLTIGGQTPAFGTGVGASNVLRTTLATDDTVTVDNGGTFSVQVSSIAAGNNNIGDVDVASLPVAFNTGTRSATTQRVTVATDDLVPVSMATNTPVGNVAHDGGDSGAPIKIGYKAESSPKGITLVADGDRTDGYADLDGIQIVKLNTSGADLLTDAISNTDGASTASAVFTAVASTKNYITTISVFRTDAGATPAYVDFRSGTAGSVLWRMPLPPNGGSVIASAVPFFATAANTALAYDTSAALSTVYISVSGYQSKV